MLTKGEKANTKEECECPDYICKKFKDGRLLTHKGETYYNARKISECRIKNKKNCLQTLLFKLDEQL